MSTIGQYLDAAITAADRAHRAAVDEWSFKGVGDVGSGALAVGRAAGKHSTLVDLRARLPEDALGMELDVTTVGAEGGPDA